MELDAVSYKEVTGCDCGQCIECSTADIILSRLGALLMGALQSSEAQLDLRLRGFGKSDRG